MTLEQQVCSLELAKRLKELGVGKMRGDSLFVWVMDTETKEYKLASFENPWYGAVTNYYAAGFDNADCPMYAAFTVAELGEMLVWIEKKRKRYIPFTYQFVGKEGFRCDLVEERMQEILHTTVAPTEADARAKMLIYLLENKLISP